MDWIRSILIAVAIAMVFRWAIGEPFRIPSESMAPTLQVGDRIWVNKWIYGLRAPFDGFRIPFTRTNMWYGPGRLFHGAKPQRWDIVVFKSAEPGTEFDTLVKRIVALPGEQVHIRDGRIHINGNPVVLPPDMPPVRYTSPPPAFTDMSYGLLEDKDHAVVPQDHYFVLGDNSASSRDGRVFGWVPERNILGRVACVWWPWRNSTDFTGFTHSWFWRGLAFTLLALGLARMFGGRLIRTPRPIAGLGVPSGTWLVVNYLALGIRVPFSSRWLIPFRLPRRGEWVSVEHVDPSGTPFLSVGRVLAGPGDRVQWHGEVHVNGLPTGVPGVARRESMPEGTLESRVAENSFIVFYQGSRNGQHLQQVDRRAIRGLVHLLGRTKAPVDAEAL